MRDRQRILDNLEKLYRGDPSWNPPWPTCANRVRRLSSRPMALPPVRVSSSPRIYHRRRPRSPICSREMPLAKPVVGWL